MATLSTITVLVSAFFVGGFLSCLANLSGVVGEQFKIPEDRRQGLRLAPMAALMIMMPLGGLLSDIWGSRPVLILGFMASAFAMASLALSKDYRAALGSIGLLGAATGLLHIATAAAMPKAIFGNSDNVVVHSPAALNLGYAFVVLGGLLVPLVIALMLKKMQFRNSLLITALLSLTPAFLATVPQDLVLTETQISVGSLFTDLRFWLSMIAIFFFYGLESAALLWAPRYLSNLGFRERHSGWLIAGFWIAFLLSRVVSATIDNPIGSIWLVLVLAFLVAVIQGNMVGIYDRTSGALSFLALGICLGPIFPTLAGLIFVEFPYQPAFAFGTICGVATVGRIIVHPLIANRIEKQQLRSTMVMSMIMALIVAVPTLVTLIIWPE